MSLAPHRVRKSPCVSTGFVVSALPAAVAPVSFNPGRAEGLSEPIPGDACATSSLCLVGASTAGVGANSMDMPTATTVALARPSITKAKFRSFAVVCCDTSSCWACSSR